MQPSTALRKYLFRNETHSGSISNRNYRCRRAPGITAGAPAVVKSYNRIGMMRNGFSEEERTFIKECFKLLYESHFNRTQALEAIRKLPDFSRYRKIKDVFEAFFKENSERGLA